MKFGLYGINVGNFCDPDWIARLLKKTEELGFESVWTSDHLLFEDHTAPTTTDDSPTLISPHLPYLETLTTLAFAAAHTEKLKLGAGVLLLPQRNPVVAAKQLAAIDVLSKGRLLVGVGIGYEKPVYDTVGVPFKERGARATEHIDVLRTVWAADKPTFDGRFTSFPNIQSKPQPVQKPCPPIIVGGLSEPAFRRAVRQGDGWFGSPFNDVEHMEHCIAGLAEAAKQVERPAELGELEISINPPPGVVVDRDFIKHCEDLGVSRIVLMSDAHDVLGFENPRDEDAVMRSLETMASTFGIG